MIQHVQINLMKMKTKLFCLFGLLLAITVLNAQVGNVLGSADDLSVDCNLEASIASTVLTCDGANVCIAIRGGIPPYTIVFGENSPATNDNLEVCFRNLQPGNYTLKVTDAEGCEASVDINIPAVDYYLEARVEHVSCFGSNDGAIHLDIPIDLAPLFFHWEGPDGYTADTESIEGLAAGVYSVSVTTLNDLCIGIGSWVVREPDPINIRVAITQPDCGQPDACVFVSGGAAPYYIWAFENLPPGVADSPNGRLSDFTDLDPGAGVPYDPTTSDTAFCAYNVPNGIYYLLVVDINLCYAWKRVVIEGRPGLERSVRVTPANCGENDGEICFKVEGGTPPYTTYISPSSTDEVIVGDNGCFPNLPPGQYKLTSKDAEGCTLEERVEVGQTSNLEAGFEITSDICSNQVDGCLKVSGGTQPYQVYVWRHNNLTDDVFVGVDFTADGTPVISDPNAERTDDLVFENDPNTNPTDDYYRCARNIPPGYYLVLIVDANRCYTMLRVHIPRPNPVEASFEIIGDTCDDQVDGCLTVEGGTRPYRIYVWRYPNLTDDTPIDIEYTGSGVPVIAGAEPIDDFGFTANPNPDGTFPIYQLCARDIPAGRYLILVVDANRCYDLLRVYIPNGTGLEAEFEITSDPCSDQVDGCLKVQGGTQPYQIYVWRHPNITDIGNVDVDFTVDGRPIISDPDLEPTDEVRFDPDPDTSPGDVYMRCAEDIPPGHYLILVVDANRCYTLLRVRIPRPNPVEASFEIIGDACDGQVDGCLNVEGGTRPYRVYVWRYPNLTDDTPVDISYDADGNPIVRDGELADDIRFDPNIDTNTNPEYRLCARDIPPGRYVVLVVDANRCYDLLRVYIPPASGLEADFEITSEACSDQVDGCLKVQGGTQPYSIWVWMWNSPNDVLPNVQFDDDGTPRIEGGTPTDDITFSPNPDDPFIRCAENIPAGYYLILVVDANGCYVLLPVYIPEPGGLALRTEVRPVSCYGEEDGAIKLAIGNGTPPFTITLNGQDWDETEEETVVFDNLGPGTYEIEVSDANQCTGTIVVELDEPEQLEMDLDYDPFGTYACVEPIGGTPPYTYVWFDLNTNTRIGRDSCVRNLSEGAYWVVVRDARACSIDEILIIDPMPCIGGEAIVDPELINSGESTVFKLVNYSGLSVQWQFKTDFTDWISILGATEDEYETPAINTGSDKVILVRAEIICSNGDVIYSTEAELKVLADDQLQQFNGLVEDVHLFNPDFRRAELAQLAYSNTDPTLTKMKATVYPTITTDFVQLKLEGTQDQVVRIDVLDELGHIVKQQVQRNYYAGESIELTMNNLTGGTYFVRITNGDQVISKRIFIIH